MRKFFLLAVVALLFAGCANHNSVTFSQMKSFWTGEPILRLNLPFPEPLSFELPNADWTVLKVNQAEGRGSVVALAEGSADSYVKVMIEGQNRTLFESLEKDSGIDFSQPDSTILLGLFDHYKTMTRKENGEKEITYGETVLEQDEDALYAWMMTTNGSYSVAYCVIKTKASNYFTVEVDQKQRSTDIETILLGIVKSRKNY